MNLRKIRPWVFYFLAWTLVGPHLFRAERHAAFLLGRSEPWQDLRYWSVNIYHIGAADAADHLGRAPLAARAPAPRRGCIGAAFAAEHRLGAARGCRSKPRSTSRGTSSGRSSRRSPFKSEITLLFIFGFHTGVVAYWVVLTIQTAIRNYARFQERAQAALRSDLRASQLETQVAQARLGALKAQLQPHFLFNTLNAIVVLVRQQKGQQAEETLARFSRPAARGARRHGRAGSDAGARARISQALSIHRAAAVLRPAARGHRRGSRAARCGRAAHGAAAHRRELPSATASGQRATPGVIVIRAAACRRCAARGGAATTARASARHGAGGGLRLGLANTRARLKQLYGDGGGAAHRGGAGRRRAGDHGAAVSFVETRHERTDRRRRTAGARRHALLLEEESAITSVAEARNGAEAVEMIRAQRPDLRAARRADARDGRLRRAARARRRAHAAGDLRDRARPVRHPGLRGERHRLSVEAGDARAMFSRRWRACASASSTQGARQPARAVAAAAAGGAAEIPGARGAALGRQDFLREHRRHAVRAGRGELRAAAPQGRRATCCTCPSPRSRPRSIRRCSCASIAR